MLALHGFDVVGLEISSKGVSIADEYAIKELSAPQPYNFGSSDPRDAGSVGKGTVKFIQGDFFKGDSVGEKFDIIYDYTVSLWEQIQTNSRLPTLWRRN